MDALLETDPDEGAGARRGAELRADLLEMCDQDQESALVEGRVKSWDEMSFDEKIAEAERRNRRQAEGKTLAPTTVEIEQRSAEQDARLEKEIQWDIMKLLRAYGFVVYTSSQTRASKISEGLADLYAVNIPRRQLLWFEVKTPTGASSPAQIEFQVFHAQLGIEGVRYVVGGVLAAEEYLISIGAAERTATGSIEPTRRV